MQVLQNFNMRIIIICMMRSTIKNKINDASKFNKLTECFDNNHLKL